MDQDRGKRKAENLPERPSSKRLLLKNTMVVPSAKMKVVPCLFRDLIRRMLVYDISPNTCSEIKTLLKKSVGSDTKRLKKTLLHLLHFTLTGKQATESYREEHQLMSRAEMIKYLNDTIFVNVGMNEEIADLLDQQIIQRLNLNHSMTSSLHANFFRWTVQQFAGFEDKDIPQHQQHIPLQIRSSGDLNREINVGYIFRTASIPSIASVLRLVATRHDAEKFRVYLFPLEEGFKRDEILDYAPESGYVTTVELSSCNTTALESHCLDRDSAKKMYTKIVDCQPNLDLMVALESALYVSPLLKLKPALLNIGHSIEGNESTGTPIYDLLLLSDCVFRKKEKHLYTEGILLMESLCIVNDVLDRFPVFNHFYKIIDEAATGQSVVVSSHDVVSEHWSTQATFFPLLKKLRRALNKKDTKIIVHNCELLLGSVDKQSVNITADTSYLLTTSEMYGLPPFKKVVACFSRNCCDHVTHFDRLVKILRHLDGSVLWMYIPNDELKQVFKKRFDKLNVGNRVWMDSVHSEPELVQRALLASICVDTGDWLWSSCCSVASKLCIILPSIPDCASTGQRVSSKMNLSVARNVLQLCNINMISKSLETTLEELQTLLSNPTRLDEVTAVIAKSRCMIAPCNSASCMLDMEDLYSQIGLEIAKAGLTYSNDRLLSLRGKIITHSKARQKKQLQEQKKIDNFLRQDLRDWKIQQSGVNKATEESNSKHEESAKKDTVDESNVNSGDCPQFGPHTLDEITNMFKSGSIVQFTEIQDAKDFLQDEYEESRSQFDVMIGQNVVNLCYIHHAAERVVDCLLDNYKEIPSGPVMYYIFLLKFKEFMYGGIPKLYEDEDKSFWKRFRIFSDNHYFALLFECVDGQGLNEHRANYGKYVGLPSSKMQTSRGQRCPFCTFNDYGDNSRPTIKSQIITHRQKCHAPPENHLVCPSCFRFFTCQDELDEHLRATKSQREYSNLQFGESVFVETQMETKEDDKSAYDAGYESRRISALHFLKQTCKDDAVDAIQKYVELPQEMKKFVQGQRVATILWLKQAISRALSSMTDPINMRGLSGTFFTATQFLDRLKSLVMAEPFPYMPRVRSEHQMKMCFKTADGGANVFVFDNENVLKQYCGCFQLGDNDRWVVNEENINKNNYQVTTCVICKGHVPELKKRKHYRLHILADEHVTCLECGHKCQAEYLNEHKESHHTTNRKGLEWKETSIRKNREGKITHTNENKRIL